ncbi:menaquinone biosynthetic enzyme MqnA/MqnD family protein [Aureliella helgolandensis]|uniref:Chorismate dehydratase n=1 Tax=Aureliella helgolandensis TaxID=2527968 RepID=A0A518GH89_9BACT|nr:menaquinone biosynthesis protein [Aureliella helgolandensis]QDV27956.1 Chorismate dehydratase [Aureliella helgolandensis]
MRHRIGAVSYLNTKPLIHGLRDRLPNIDLDFDLPSRLADRLNHGELDVALIPSVEFLRGAGLQILSDACIACRGPVRSVRLLFRRPPSQTQTLALDVGSRTSAVLAQVLLQQQHGVRPSLVPFDIDARLDQIDADAVLIIGDRAMDVPAGQYVENWDLGEQWCNLTGLPFVFAMWVTNQRSIEPGLSVALQEARDQGLAAAEQLAAQYAATYGISTADCVTYFRQQLHFHLGERELAGLDLFRRQAAELRLLPATSTQLSLELL